MRHMATAARAPGSVEVTEYARTYAEQAGLHNSPRSAIIVRCGVPAPELYEIGGSDFVDGGLSRAFVVVNLVVGGGPRSFASFAGRSHSSSLSGWSRRSSCVRGSAPRRAQ